MNPYSQHKPTAFDSHLEITIDDPSESRETWLTLDVTRTRDSGPLAESNFASALAMLGGESDTVEVHRFGHWGPGWYEIILVRPGTEAARIGAEIEALLADYPILNESDYSEREQIAADETWAACYRDHERVAYIRDHRNQFEFNSFADLMSCARGKYFAGYASELVEDSGY